MKERETEDTTMSVGEISNAMDEAEAKEVAKRLRAEKREAKKLAQEAKIKEKLEWASW